jgi:hypothetical protein
MRRATLSFTTTAAGLATLGVGLAVIDPRVREHVAALASGRGPGDELVTASERTRDLVYVALDAVRDQSIEHAPLTLFALAALVLFTLMLRS